MKTVIKKFNCALSIMLAAAMLLTMTPQAAMPVLAAAEQDVEKPSETPAAIENVEDDEDEPIEDEESDTPSTSPETPEMPETPPGEEQPAVDVEDDIIIADDPAAGTEDSSDYVPPQTTDVTTAVVAFQTDENENTISLANGSDAATISIDGTNLDSATGYPITNTTEDVEVAVSAPQKVFEVMYSVSGGILTSAAKKSAESDYFTGLDVSYSTGTYIIPKEALTGNVEITIYYLKEITLDWQGDANWQTIEANATATRVQTTNPNNDAIWAVKYLPEELGKNNVLLAPQDTKVELAFTPYQDFEFTAVNYRKTGDTTGVTDAVISSDKKSASLIIDNIENNDYTVTVNAKAVKRHIQWGANYSDCGTMTVTAKVDGEALTPEDYKVIKDTTKDLPVTITVAAKEGHTIDRWINALRYGKAEDIARPDVKLETLRTSQDNISINADGSIEYAFRIPKADLTGNLALLLDLDSMTRIDVHFDDDDSKTNYEMFTVSLNPSLPAGGKWTDKKITDVKDSVLYVPMRSNLNVIIKAVDGYKLNQVWWGDKEKSIAANKQTCTFTVNQVGDIGTSISIGAGGFSEGRLSPITLDGSAVQDAANREKWTVAPRADYDIFIAYGNQTFTLHRVEFSKKIDNVSLEQVTRNGTVCWVLKVGDVKGPNNQMVDLKLYNNKNQLDKTLKLTLIPVTSSVTVTGNGVTKKAVDEFAIKQTIGTEKAYTVTPDAKTSTDVLGIKPVIDNPNLEAKFENNKLIIKTNAVMPKESAAAIKITNESDPNQKTIATVKVETTRPTWAADVTTGTGGAAPTVKLASSTDIELKLDMTLPKGVTQAAPEGTKYYYKVTPKAQAASKKTDFIYIENTVYVPATENTAVTRETLKVIDAAFGQGTDTKFDVTVQLVQYTVGGTNPVADDTVSDKPVGAGELIASSKSVTVKGLATKPRYYADKITLKKTKAASGIYTGQTAEVAAVDFGKNTTYNRDRDVHAWVKEFKDSSAGADSIISVKTSAIARDNAGDLLTVMDGRITLVVGKDVKPGKYTLCVEQTVGADLGIPQDSVQAGATLPITVVQGIKEIEAASASTILVTDTKAGTAKITAVYNGGDTAKKPKTAKVKYEIGKVENGAFTKDDEIAAKVTVKNGTVTVPKGYKKGGITGDTFAVNVVAADFENNEAADFVVYEIVTNAQELGDVVLVEEVVQSGGTGAVRADAPVYEIVDNTDGKYGITADKVSKTQVRVLKKQDAAADVLSEDSFVDPKLYALTFSNKKDVGVGSDNKTLVFKGTKVVTNVSIKAKTTDGGNKTAANDKNPPKLTVNYETVNNPTLQLDADGTFKDFDKTSDKRYTKAVTTPTGAVIKVRAMDGDKALTKRLVNYKVSVTGAKIVNNNDDKNNLNIEIVMNKKDAVLTLSDQRGTNDSKVTYTITNEMFDPNKKAPKVSLVGKQTLYAKYDHEQTLKFTVDKWVAKNNGDMSKVKKLKVTAAPDKASQALYALVDDSSKTISNVTLSATGKTTFEITFKSTKEADIIKNGILRFDFVDENDAVVTQTSPDVKITTALLKKSYKLTNKYNMSTKDAAKVRLVHSGKPAGVAKKADSDEFDVTFHKILNANIKGEVNHFRDAFELVEAEDSSADNKKYTGVLKLKSTDYAKKVYGKTATNKGINNLIGFVQYTVKYADGTTDDFTTQITINIDVDNAKKATITGLKVAAKPVMKASDMAPVITVTNSKKAPVKLVCAEYKTVAKARSDSEIFEVDEMASDYEKGMVVLKLKKGAQLPDAGSKIEGTLTVIPEDNFYAADAKAKHDAAAADGASDDVKKAYAGILELAGIPFGIKTDVKAAAVSPKVKVESRDSKIVFENLNESKEASYTVVISASVAEIKRSEAKDKNGNLITPDWITFAKASGNAVTVSINRQEYVDWVKDGGKDTRGNYKRNAGNAVDVAAEVTYNDANAPKDTLKYKVVLPKITENEFGGGGIDWINVEIAPKAVTLPRGKTQRFRLINKKTGETIEDSSISWDAQNDSGGRSRSYFGKGTDSNLLTVSEDEDAARLRVSASREEAPSSWRTVATALVTVSGIPDYEVSIQKKSNVITSDEVRPGETVQYNAVENMSTQHNAAWSLEDYTGGKQTSIDENGRLTVASDEAVGTTFKIKATSKMDDRKSAVITVTVKAAENAGT